MMTLPATIETQALAFAREHVAYVRDGKLQLWGTVPGRWFGGDDSERICQRMLTDWALVDVHNLVAAVEFARAGFELWRIILRDVIAEYQNGDRPGEMPFCLRAHAVEVTLGRHQVGRAGRHRADLLLRDL